MRWVYDQYFTAGQHAALVLRPSKADSLLNFLALLLAAIIGALLTLKLVWGKEAWLFCCIGFGPW